MATVSAIFNARDRVSGNIDRMTRSAGGFRRSLNNIARAGVVAFGGLTASAGIFLTGSTRVFNEFEDGLREVFTLLPGISEPAMEDIREQVLDLSEDLRILPADIIPSLYQALSAGVPQNNVFEFLRTAQMGARGGISTLETSVETLTSVVNAYGTEIIDANRASDLIFTTIRLGRTTFEELGSSLFNVIPVAASAGVSFEEVSAALAAITAAGTPTSVATTQIRSAISELSSAGSRTDEIFRRIAGRGFREFISQGGTLQEALAMLEQEANRNNLSISDLFSRIEAGQAALLLTGDNTERFTNNIDAMGDSAGATEMAFNTMSEGLTEDTRNLRAFFDRLRIEVIDRLEPSFRDFTQGVIMNADDIQEAILGIVDFFINLRDEVAPRLDEIGGLLIDIAEEYFPNVQFSAEDLGEIITNLITGTLDLLIETLTFIRDNSEEIVTSFGRVLFAAEVLGLALLALRGAYIANAVAQGVSILLSGIETGVIIALYTAEFIVAAATQLWTLAQIALNTALIANPIGAVVALVAILITAITVAYQRSETFRNILDFLWDALRIGAREVFGAIIRNIDFFIERINDVINLINNIPGVEIGNLQTASELIDNIRNRDNIPTGENQSLQESIQPSQEGDIPITEGSVLDQLGLDSSLLANQGITQQNQTIEDNRTYRFELPEGREITTRDRDFVLGVINEALDEEVAERGDLSFEF